MNDVGVLCSDLKPILDFVAVIVTLIQIGIPILLIIMGSIDLGKAVVASKEDEIKAAQKLLIKRAIAAVAVFFVVFIVKLVIRLAAGSGAAGIISCISASLG